MFSAAAQVQIEGDFLPCSFSILEEQPMDMLLGLDMLKRHQVSSGHLRLTGGALPSRSFGRPVSLPGLVGSSPSRPRSASTSFRLPQCSIDLKNNMLVIGTTGSQTSFLPEGELPECAKLAYGLGREDMRPDELADQELAEALQKSADEAGTRAGLGGRALPQASSRGRALAGEVEVLNFRPALIQQC